MVTRSVAANVQEAPPALDERQLRVQLAAAYRLVDRLGMTDTIYNHISVRLPGQGDQFLLNPVGLLYSEVTASNLVKIDLEGNILESTEWGVSRAGFVIHSAIHAARPDVQCVIHTHTRYGVAVSALESGLLPVSQTAMRFYGKVAYHDYEGLATSLDEQKRLVADLADKPALIFRNHGLLTAGRSVGDAFTMIYYLEKACEHQILAQSAGKIRLPSKEVCELTASQTNSPKGNERVWEALVRQLDREDPSYKD